MNQYSDVKLAQLIKQSDQNAFHCVYERYYEFLFYYLWSFTGNEDTANDLIQEVFIRLWKNREKLNTKKTLKPFLFRIAHNLAIDYQRKKKVRNLFFKDIEDVNIIDDKNDLELKTRISIAIQKIPEKFKVVFILHHIKKYTYEEIAELCEISKKTVENRMKKAIWLLQKLLIIF